MWVVAYKLVHDYDPSKLEERVNEQIAAGWQPLGGVTSDRGLRTQALVIYAPAPSVELVHVETRGPQPDRPVAIDLSQGGTR